VKDFNCGALNSTLLLIRTYPSLIVKWKGNVSPADSPPVLREKYCFGSDGRGMTRASSQNGEFSFYNLAMDPVRRSVIVECRAME
jgi:hypothetical protein